MFKKHFITAILAGLLAFCLLSSYNKINYENSNMNVEFAFYPPELKTTISTLQKLPEVRQLLADISKDGKVGVEMVSTYSENFDAMWDSKRRVIMVNPHKKASEGNLICSILFEMHNASTDKRFVNLVNMARNGSITKDQYVERVEKMEHENCLNTIAILQKGIERGIFPSTSHWKVFKSFDDHYKIQQIHGHSGWLADSYDRYRNQNVNRNLYKGTIEQLHSLRPEDKQDLSRFFALKYKLENASDDQDLTTDLTYLKEEYVSVNYCYLGNPCEYTRAAEKKKWLEEVFKGYPQYEKLSKEMVLWGQISKSSNYSS